MKIRIESGNMKKQLVIKTLALSFLLLGSLSGCGKKQIKPFVMPENGYDGSKVTITFYHAMGQELQGVLNKYVQKFEEEFPNITVVEKYIGNYDAVRDQLVNEISIGEGANVAYCYPDHISLYNKSKRVVTLDQFIDDTKTYSYTTDDGETKEYTFGLTQEQKDDFVEVYYEEGKIFGDDLLYSLPYAKSTEILYYNKTFFDKHNLTVPTTWDEMWKVCAKIKEIDKKSIPLGYDSDSNFFITMCEQLGTGYTSSDSNEHFIFNNDDNKKWLAELKTYYDLGYFTTKGLSGTYTSSIFTAAANEGEVCSYMCIGSSAGASYQSPDKDSEGNYLFEVEIAPIPQFDLDNPKAVQQGPSLCIFNDANVQEVCASWLFVKYIETNKQMQAEISTINGYTPVLKSVSEIPVYKNWVEEGKDLQAKATKVCIEQISSNFVSPAFIGSSKARDEVGSALDAVLSGSKSIDKALQDAYDECKYSAN